MADRRPTSTTMSGRLVNGVWLVPLQNQEREDKIRAQLKVLGRLQRGDKLHCGVHTEIETKSWYQGAWRYVTGQSKALSKEAVAIIMDDSIQHVHTLMQHAFLASQREVLDSLMRRIDNLLADMRGAIPGIRNVVETTYVHDTNFESIMRVKIENIENTLQEIDNARGQLLGGNRTHSSVATPSGGSVRSTPRDIVGSMSRDVEHSTPVQQQPDSEDESDSQQFSNWVSYDPTEPLPSLSSTTENTTTKAHDPVSI